MGTTAHLAGVMLPYSFPDGFVRWMWVTMRIDRREDGSVQYLYWAWR